MDNLVIRSKSREEQTTGVPDLLKSYQDEIDQLSRRAKLTETIFLGLYKSLYDCPDPAIIMEHLVASQTQAMKELSHQNIHPFFSRRLNCLKSNDSRVNYLNTTWNFNN